MKKNKRILSFVLSAVLLLNAMPGWASAATEVKTVLPNTRHDGGFQIGTYGDVAAVWENVYYNPATGDMVEDLDDIEELYPHVARYNVDDTSDNGSTNILSFERSGLVESAREESGVSPYNDYVYVDDMEEEDENRPNEWFWRPMYLVRADEKGLHRISDYYAELTGISETGHAGAKGFCGRWGAIDYKGDSVYDFIYDSLEEMEGYVEPRTTRNTSTRERSGYMTQLEDHSHMLIVITEESEKVRAYHNGYVITQRGDGCEDVMDEAKERLLPASMKYDKLSDVSDTGYLWAGNDDKLTAVYQIVDEKPQRRGDEEYIYDEKDVGEDVYLPTDLLDKITDVDSAVSAVNALTDGMTDAQKNASTGIDLATLYAETAAMRVSCKKLSGSDLTINAALLGELESLAREACIAVDQALASGSVFSARVIRSTAVFQTDETGINVHLEPDLLGTSIQIIRIETPDYALAFDVSDLETDLTETITVSAESVGTGYAPRMPSGKKGERPQKSP